MASEIKVDTVSEKTSANGVTIDGVNIKDSKITTANSIDSDVYIDGSIDNAHIADDAIDSEHYAAGSIDTAHIADDQVTLAKMAGGTDGNIISFDASGDPVAVATGTDGQVLTSSGAGAVCAFETLSAGKIGQVVSTVKTDTTSSTSTTYADITGMSQAITPVASSSKVLIQVTLNLSVATGSGINVLLLNGSSGISLGDAASARSRSSGVWQPQTNITQWNFHLSYVDSPSTTSAVTYKMQWLCISDTMYLNRTVTDTDSSDFFGRCASNIICSEILA